MTPWYSGFKGTIVKDSINKYVSTGKYTRINSTTIEVTELPIGRWTQTYKEFLDSLLEENEIVDYTNNSDDLVVSFKVVLQKTVLDELINKNELIKKFKLTSIINTSNMHVFDHDCKIIKVSCPEEIIIRFYSIRKNHFVKRKTNILKKLNKEYSVLNSKVVFIKLVISEKVVVFNKKKDSIITQLEKFDELIKIDNCYDYLLDLKIWTFTKERITELETQLDKIKKDINIITNKSIESIWQSELDTIHGLFD
jgi:DNA topoisomerase-2